MKYKYKIWCLTGIVLLALSSLFSCTYDYFVDETNIKVRVAEVVDSHDEVDNVLVAVHNSSTGAYQGSVFLTKANGTFSAGMNESASFWDNIIRFKVPQMPDLSIEYQVACFVNVDSASVREVTDKEISAYYVREATKGTEANLYSTNEKFRAGFKFVNPPVGATTEYTEFEFTDGQQLVEDTLQAQVQCWFDFSNINDATLASLESIVVRFKTSTHFYLDGYFYQANRLSYTDMDSWVEYVYTNVSSQISEKKYEPATSIYLFPSPGAMRDSSVDGNGMDVVAYYYTSAGNIIAESNPAYLGAQIPVYETDGSVAGYLGNDFSMKPADRLRIVFSGFIDVLGWINPVDWEDIIEGGSDGGTNF